MGRTIIQPIGPLYGEAVNGTVFGRPNGSIYVPDTNTISLAINATHIKYYSGVYVGCNSSGVVQGGAVKITAKSQDVASNIRTSVFSDAALTTQVGTSKNETAGAFNVSITFMSSDSSDNLVSGNTYYVVSELINNGVAVAVSAPVELEAY